MVHQERTGVMLFKPLCSEIFWMVRFVATNMRFLKTVVGWMSVFWFKFGDWKMW